MTTKGKTKQASSSAAATTTATRASATTIAVRSVDVAPDIRKWPAPPSSFTAPAPVKKTPKGQAPKANAKKASPKQTTKPHARLTNGQLGAAAALAGELFSSDLAAYHADFTKNAADPAKLAPRLELAGSWYAVVEWLRGYTPYAEAMLAASQDAAARDGLDLAKKYRAARSDDSSLAKRYPELDAWVGLKDRAVAQALHTKGRTKAAKNAAAAKAGTTPSGTGK